MRKLFTIIVLFAIIGGCAPRRETAASSSVSVTDDAGRTVTLARVPLRIASLAPSATEMLYALGCGDRVIGVTSWCDFPPQARQKPVLGDAVSFNAEKLLALKPDLAVLAGTAQTPALAKLEALGIPVIVLDPKSPAEVIKDLKLLGIALTCSTLADSIARTLQGSLNEIWNPSQMIQAQRPLVFAEIGINPLYTASDDSYLGQMIAIAGGRNIAGKLPQEYAAINAEAVVAADPEVILVLHPMARRSDVRSRIGWAGISAVRSGRVYDDIDLDVVLRPGPRFVQGLRELRRVLYAP